MTQGSGRSRLKGWLALGGMVVIGCGCLLCLLFLIVAYSLGDTLLPNLPGFKTATSTPTLTLTKLPSKTRPATLTITPIPTKTLSRTPRPTLTQSPVYTPADTSTPFPTQTINPNILSPQGPWQLYESNSGLWVSNPDGGAMTVLPLQLLAAGVKGISVAPKGGLLAWLEMSSSDNPESLAIKIIQIPTLREVALIPLISTADSVRNRSQISNLLKHPGMSWSPDGEWLVFPALLEGPSVDLYLYRISTGKMVRLTDNSGQEYDPHWSPDGNHVVYFNTYQDDNHIEWVGTWMVDPVSLVQTLLYEPISNQQVFLGWNDFQSFYTYHSNEICKDYGLRLVNTATTRSLNVVEGCFNGVAYDQESGNIMISVDEALSVSCPCARQTNPAGTFFLPQGQGLPQAIDSRSVYGILYKPLARLFFTKSNVGWTSAYSQQGYLVPIPPSVLGEIPEVSSASGFWAWGPIVPMPVYPGISLGSPGQNIQSIYKGPARLPRWNTDGKKLLFMDGQRLFLSTFPDFSPIQIYFFPSEIEWIQSIWP